MDEGHGDRAPDRDHLHGCIYPVDKCMMLVDKYIEIMGQRSETSQHELILECLKKYGIQGTRELTEQQVREFLEEKEIETHEHEVRAPE